MSGNDLKRAQHPIFTKDPKLWTKHVHKLVELTTEDGQQHKGYVYTVDPVSECVVLLNPSKLHSNSTPDFSSMSLTLLPGPAFKNLKILSDVDPGVSDAFDGLFRPATSSKALSVEELEGRKQQLKSWLEQHRLPVSISPDSKALIVAGALTITPPYTEESCLSTNEIILSRIRTLIRDMPIEDDSNNL